MAINKKAAGVFMSYKWLWVGVLILGLFLNIGMVPAQTSNHSPLLLPTNRYVSTKGSNQGDCKSSSSPCKTIKYAISKSVAGDIIHVAPGTYTELCITVNKNLTIRGAGKGKTIVQAASKPDTATNRVFLISEKVTATIEKMTIRYGKANFGAGVFIDQNANAKLNTVKITENKAVGSTSMDGLGGGVLVNSSATLTLANSEVHKNKASGQMSEGGGIFTYCKSKTTISYSKITSNSANHGGGIGSGDILSISNSGITDNYAEFGGGGLSISGTTTLNQTTIANNGAGSYGGGIQNAGAGVLTINNSTVSGNKTPGSGGGINNGSSKTVTINRSTIYSNGAYHGGGINHAGVTGNAMIIKNSTISKNNANWGGAIYNTGVITISHTTMSENETNPSGVAGIYYAGTVKMKSSIIANSKYGDNCQSIGGKGKIISAGKNLSTDKTCQGFTQVTSSQLNLGSLLHNLPGTTKTHALPANSAAVNAASDCTDYLGNAVITDQRGVKRPQPKGGKCDIGSYERNGVTTTSSTFPAGDINGDLKTNVIDARIIEWHAGGFGKLGDEALALADLDKNGLVDIMDASAVAKAGLGIYVIPLHNLKVVAMGPGSGTITSTPAGIECGIICSANFQAGKIVTLTAIPDEDSILAGWEGCDEITRDMKCRVEMHTGRLVAAVFDLDSRSAIRGHLEKATTGGGHTRSVLPWLFASMTFVAVVGVRSGRNAPWMIFGLALFILTSCTPSEYEYEVPEPQIVLHPVSLPPGATGSVAIYVEQIDEGDGIASLQGRITYDPELINVQWLYGENDFVLKAIEIDNERGMLLFAIVKPNDGGITTGAIASIAVQVVSSSDEQACLHWDGDEDVPSVVGGANNQELIGVGLLDGCVEIR